MRGAKRRAESHRNGSSASNTSFARRSLVMRSGSILVELKAPYGYCGNENGRTLSSHNHLSFYTGDSRSMAVAKVGTLYTDEFLEKLADEIEEVRTRDS